MVEDTSNTLFLSLSVHFTNTIDFIITSLTFLILSDQILCETTVGQNDSTPTLEKIFFNL